MKRSGSTLVLALGISLVAAASNGQQLIIKGEYGLMSGTMAPPGFYVGAIGSGAFADELVGPDGKAADGPQLDQWAFGPLVQWVSPFKILGADYGVATIVPFANIQIDFPRLDVTGSTGVALSQLYVSPLNLGWHFPQFDMTFTYAFYPPTGRYTAGAPNNTGLGMWCNEFQLRGTVFFDAAKNWHLSTGVFFDLNGKKQDLDWKTGNPLTVMYGLGANYGCGKLFKGWLGVAGYGQWQVSDTTGRDAPLPARLNKTEIYGIGPEFTTLQGALTFRYFWQFGGKFTTRGQGFFVQFAMPL
jgi:hypothetical protein